MPEAMPQSQSVLGDMQPFKAIVKLAIPATLALLAQAVYNIVDTAYIGILRSDIALTAVAARTEDNSPCLWSRLPFALLIACPWSVFCIG